MLLLTRLARKLAHKASRVRLKSFLPVRPKRFPPNPITLSPEKCPFRH